MSDVKLAAGSAIAEHLRTSADVLRETAGQAPAIERAASAIVTAFAAGRKLYLCGNGGSAADAQHIAAEFTSVLRQDFPRPPLAAIALTTDTSFLTANANDYGFERGFARLVEAYVGAGDVLMAISTSGKSPNVVHAVERASSRGATVIALVGENPGPVGAAAHIVIAIPSTNVQHIQEAHTAVGHIICRIVEETLFA